MPKAAVTPNVEIFPVCPCTPVLSGRRRRTSPPSSRVATPQAATCQDAGVDSRGRLQPVRALSQVISISSCVATEFVAPAIRDDPRCRRRRYLDLP